MIVDFQHHFTPRELIKEDPGDKLIVRFDENGAPSYTVHSLLYDLDEHIRMMDAAGIDAALLTSANGMSASLEISRICNDRAKQAEREFLEAVRLAPDNADIHYQWGLYYKVMKIKSRAVAEMRAAVRLNPRHDAARVELAALSPRDSALSSLKKLFS